MATVPDKSGNSPAKDANEPHYKTRNELLQEIATNTAAP